MKFSTIAKELRDESGLSQMALSKKIGISAAAIGHLELNKREPGSNTLIAYSKFFKVSIDYLLGLEDDFGARTATAPLRASLPSAEYSSTERQLIEEFRKLPADSRKLILRMVGIDEAQTSRKKA